MIHRGLALLDIKTVEEGVAALVKGPRGYEHQFIPQEAEGRELLCEICEEDKNSHFYGGDWDMFERTASQRANTIHVKRPVKD